MFVCSGSACHTLQYVQHCTSLQAEKIEMMEREAIARTEVANLEEEVIKLREGIKGSGQSEVSLFPCLSSQLTTLSSLGCPTNMDLKLAKGLPKKCFGSLRMPRRLLSVRCGPMWDSGDAPL